MNTTPAPAPRTAHVFSRRERIAKRRDFLQTYEHGRKEYCRHVVIFAIPNEFGHPRLGITATRKLGKANVRNKVKRWVRELFRRHRTELGLTLLAIDIVVNVKNTASSAQFNEFADDLSKGLRRVAGRFRPA